MNKPVSITRLTESDLPDLLKILDRPEVSRPLIGLERFEAVRLHLWLELGERAERAGSVGLYAVRGSGGELAGLVGLLALDSQNEKDLFLIYAIDAPSTGRGVATAVSREVLELAKSRGIERIRATVDAMNPSSARVLEKLGFQFSDELEFGGLRVAQLELS